MTPKKNYSRFFIILQEEERGYTLDRDKTPSGYVKLEKNHGKCKVSYYVQNINPKMQPYYMALVCADNDNKKIVNLGKLSFDDSGKIEVSNDYDSENISGTGISMEKVTGAAIVKLVDNNVIGIMSGFNASIPPKGWQNYELVMSQKGDTRAAVNMFDSYEERIEMSKSKSRAEKADVSIEQDQKEVSNSELNNCDEESKVREESNNEKVEATESSNEDDVVEVESIHDEECEIESESLTESNAIVNMERSKSDADSSEDGKLDLYEYDYSGEEEYYEEDEEAPVGVTGQYFRGIVEDCEDFVELEEEIHNCKWKKVAVKDIEELHNMCNYDKHVVLYYPMACYHSYITKHGHFIFGMKMDKNNKLKYLVYGIPGGRSKEDQPFGGKTGFVTWIPCKGKHDHGYWVMFYDYKNSTVVIPVKR